MRLLIAEDEVDLAEALAVFFEKNHFSVDAVHNGFDAYEYASSGAYDAVILDVMMPKMDGIQVLEKLRQEGVKTPKNTTVHSAYRSVSRMRASFPAPKFVEMMGWDACPTLYAQHWTNVLTLMMGP